MTGDGGHASRPSGREPGTERRFAWVWPLAAILLAIIAYRPLFEPGPARPDPSLWFFEPDGLPTLPVVGVATWLAWRRRGRLCALPADRRPVLSATFVAAGLVAFLWARLSGAPDLLVLSLASNALALAGASRGLAGCRVLAVPLLALLFAIPVPGLLQNELVWMLQRWSASAARALMNLGGLEVGGHGVLLNRGEAGFLVVESCSGLRGIQTLTLIALVVRDLFASAGRRQWLLVAFAPGLALGLNVVRVAWIAARGGGLDSSEGHVAQGMAVLLTGTVALFVMGHFLARGATEGVTPGSGASLPMPWKSLCGSLALLSALSLWVSPWPVLRPSPPRLAELFSERAGWKTQAVETDRSFVGKLRLGEMIQRSFQHPGAGRERPAVIELFVGVEAAGEPRRSPFSSKLVLPGPDWSIGATQRVRDWRLWRDVDVVIASREEQSALVYTWRLGDEGSLRELLRSFLALEQGPFARRDLRCFVRIATPLEGDGTRARADAKQAIDRFIIDYGGDLEALDRKG